MADKKSLAPNAKDIAKSRKRHYFTRMKEAQAKLAEKIDTYIELHEVAARKAADRGDSSPVQWLLSHVGETNPETGELERPVSVGVDKQEGPAAHSGPRILIGVNLGGMKQLAATATLTELPPPTQVVIDATPADETSNAHPAPQGDLSPVPRNELAGENDS